MEEGRRAEWLWIRAALDSMRKDGELSLGEWAFAVAKAREELGFRVLKRDREEF